MSPFLTVFMPAFNEQANLQRSVPLVLAALAGQGVTCEVLVVDDGSRDQTGQIVDQLAAQFPNFHAVHHPRNLGVGAAFLTAIQHAQGEWLIFIPADLALEPGEIARYIQAAPGADIVVGLRSDRSDYTLLRRLVSWVNIRLIQILFGIHLRQFQYISMYRLDALRQITIDYWRSAFFLPEVLIKARDQGRVLVEVEIRYAPRLSGRPTGAKLMLIIHTVYDIFHFWIRWLSEKISVKFSRRVV